MSTPAKRDFLSNLLFTKKKICAKIKKSAKNTLLTLELPINGRRFALFIFFKKEGVRPLFSERKEGDDIMADATLFLAVLLLLVITIYIIIKK